MQSLRHPNVDPPDRRQLWEAPSHTRSTAGPLTPPPAFPSRGNQEDTSGGWQTNKIH